jgi:hypothetical protein
MSRLAIVPLAVGYMAGAWPVPGWLLAPVAVVLSGPLAPLTLAGVVTGAAAWGLWAARCVWAGGAA